MIRSHPGFSCNWPGIYGQVKTFENHAEEYPCHVVLKPRRLEPMFKMADGAGEMCRRNLGFQPSKKTTKGQFLIFFMERYYCIRIHWRRYVISHDNRAESNFHSRRGRRVVVNNLSCLYFERSKRAYYVRTFNLKFRWETRTFLELMSWCYLNPY